jgi:hypothetical protein
MAPERKRASIIGQGQKPCCNDLAAGEHLFSSSLYLPVTMHQKAGISSQMQVSPGTAPIVHEFLYRFDHAGRGRRCPCSVIGVPVGGP